MCLYGPTLLSSVKTIYVSTPDPVGKLRVIDNWFSKYWQRSFENRCEGLREFKLPGRVRGIQIKDDSGSKLEKISVGVSEK